MRIKIKTKHGNVEAEVDENYNPQTARAIVEVLPITGRANTWGDEIYFEIPVNVKSEKAQQEMEVGDLAYWVSGSCFCIFFGKTPMSTNGKPIAASAVNRFGKILGNIEILRKVKDGEEIRVEKA